MQTLFTIGFTKKSLREFVGLLRNAGVTKLIDIRLRNTSQLAGYAKKEDLEFVLEQCGIGYQHVPELAPSDSLLDDYRKGKDWERFARRFKALLRRRDPVAALSAAADSHQCLCVLCTEDQPDKCHRRLVAEYVQKRVPGLEVVHL